MCRLSATLRARDPGAGKVDKPDSVRKSLEGAFGKRHGQAGLANAGRSGEGEEAYISGEQLFSCGFQLLISPEQDIRLFRQVMGRLRSH